MGERDLRACTLQSNKSSIPDASEVEASLFSGGYVEHDSTKVSIADSRLAVAAENEARRMISEKIEAGFALQAMALTGGLGLTADGAASKMVTHYRRKVRANRRRLAKG